MLKVTRADLSSDSKADNYSDSCDDKRDNSFGNE